jgi:hypothetical protein
MKKMGEKSSSRCQAWRRNNILSRQRRRGAAIINAFMFEKMLGNELSQEKEKMLEQAEQFYSEHRPAVS